MKKRKRKIKAKTKKYWLGEGAKPIRCLVGDCTNMSDEGTFCGPLCMACYTMLRDNAVKEIVKIAKAPPPPPPPYQGVSGAIVVRENNVWRMANREELDRLMGALNVSVDT